jgi:predicted transcriptional regulator
VGRQVIPIILRTTLQPNTFQAMEVRFNPDLQARLTQRATQQGRAPDEFVQDVIASYLEEEDRFVEAVKRGEETLKQQLFVA